MEYHADESGPQAEGQQTEGQQTEGQQPDGQQAEGQQPDGAQPHGAQPDGQQAGGPPDADRDEPQAPARQPLTGEPRVDAALARLDELPDLPVTEHRAVFEHVHRSLTDVLGELDAGDDARHRGPRPGPNRPG